MLKNPNGSPGPEAEAIPDGLEVNTGANYSTAPQPYQPAHAQPYYDQSHVAHTPQTNYSETTYNNNNNNNNAPLPPMPEKGGSGSQDGRICGLHKGTFWLMVFCVALLSTLIAVAGALGATIASKNSEIAA